MEVQIRLARPEEGALIAGLMQFYFHDFSEFYPDAAFEWELDAAGRYDAYPYLDSYWRDADRKPFLIETDGRAAGFALINAHSQRGETIDYAVAEFFILRQHRRSGVGLRAARSIFTGNAGRWELAVAAGNAAARAFWPKAVLDTPGVRELTAVKVQPNDRIVLSFTVEPT